MKTLFLIVAALSYEAVNGAPTFEVLKDLDVEKVR